MISAFLARPLVARALPMVKYAVALFLVLWAVFYVLGLRADVARLSTWQDTTVAAIRAEVPVARRKAVTADTAVNDIQWLGREYRGASGALEQQSAAVRAAAAQAFQVQKAVETGLERATARDKGRKATKDAITAPGRTTGLTAAEWGQL